MVGTLLMTGSPTTCPTQEPVVDGGFVRRLGGLVTNGPRDLEIALAMSAHGFDAVKWAEGQGMLAELVSFEIPASGTLMAAATWYDEASEAARQALGRKPQLLAKLGLGVGT